jgi:flagellar hook-length control protein FliK
MLTPDLLSVLMRGIGARDQAWGRALDPAIPAEQPDFDSILRRETGCGSGEAKEAGAPDSGGIPEADPEGDRASTPPFASREAARLEGDGDQTDDGGRETEAAIAPSRDAEALRRDAAPAEPTGPASAEPARPATAEPAAASSDPPDRVPGGGPDAAGASTASAIPITTAAAVASLQDRSAEGPALLPGAASASPDAAAPDVRAMTLPEAPAATADRIGPASARLPAETVAAPSPAPARPLARDLAGGEPALPARDGAAAEARGGVASAASATPPSRKADPVPGPSGAAAPAAPAFPTAAPAPAGPAAAGATILAEAPAPGADAWRLAAATEADDASPRASAADRAAPRPAVVPGQAGMLVRHVQPAVAAGESGRLEIRLDPPELGRVQIELRFAEGSLHALLIAERPEAGEIMRRHADWLQREFEAAGCGSVILDFARGRDPGDGRDGLSQAPGSAVSPVEAREAAAGTPPLPVSNGRLDIRL